MATTTDFESGRLGSKRKSLITLAIYIACLVGSVALANFAGRPTAFVTAAAADVGG